MHDPDHILIMEDDANTAVELQKNILGEEMGWAVVTASTIQQALNLIQRAQERYLVAILDFKMSSDVDASVCLEIRRRMPSTRIIHITAAVEDKIIELHMAHVHGESLSSGSAVSKNSTEWVEIVIRGIYNAFINDALDGLAAVPIHTARSFQRVRSRTQSSLTGRLSKVTTDLMISWNKLDDDTKKRVRDIFVIDESAPQRINISLIAPE